MALVASAALCARLAILAVLVAAGVAGISRVEFQLIAYALAVTSAIQVIVDSSTAGSFTVVNWDRYAAIGKSLWSGVLRLQAVAAVFVCLGPMAIIGAVGHSREGLLVGAAVGATAMSENIARFARCRYQRGLEFGHFAAVDLTLGAARLVGAVTLIVWSMNAFLLVQFSVCSSGSPGWRSVGVKRAAIVRFLRPARARLLRICGHIAPARPCHRRILKCRRSLSVRWAG